MRASLADICIQRDETITRKRIVRGLKSERERERQRTRASMLIEPPTWSGSASHCALAFEFAERVNRKTNDIVPLARNCNRGKPLLKWKRKETPRLVAFHGAAREQSLATEGRQKGVGETSDRRRFFDVVGPSSALLSIMVTSWKQWEKRATVIPWQSQRVEPGLGSYFSMKIYDRAE